MLRLVTWRVERAEHVWVDRAALRYGACGDSTLTPLLATPAALEDVILLRGDGTQQYLRAGEVHLPACATSDAHNERAEATGVMC